MMSSVSTPPPINSLPQSTALALESTQQGSPQKNPLQATHHALGTSTQMPHSKRTPQPVKGALAASVGLNLALGATTIATLRGLTQLEKATSTDGLTGLHTKAFIIQHGNEVVNNLRKANPGHEVYAFHMDLNGLKLMNDFMSKGHGDKLLQLVEPVVAEKTSPNETALFRYGSSGDEFELFMTAKNQAEAAKKMNAIQMNMLRQTHEWPEISNHLKREGDRIGRTYTDLQDYIVYQEYLKALELMKSPPSWENFKQAAVAKLDDRIRKPLGLTVAGMKIADSIESGKPHTPIDFAETLQELTQMESRARDATTAGMESFYKTHDRLTPQNRNEFIPGLVFESRGSVRPRKPSIHNPMIPKITVWNNVAKLVKGVFRV